MDCALRSAKGAAPWAPAWCRRFSSDYRPVAQLAERRSPKPQVGGSIPSWPANYLKYMTNTKNSKIQFQEISAWLAMVVLTVAAFFGTYYFHFSAPIKALIWIGWLVVMLGLG